MTKFKYFLSSLKATTKIIQLNIILILTIILLPKLSLEIFRYLRSAQGGKVATKSHYPYYPVYKDTTISAQTYNEIKKLESDYFPFIGWRRNPVNYKYTNIEGLYKTRKSINQDLNNSVWFFGGSAMWGTGTTDSGTIPSIYANKTGSKVMNFGESGWNSRQSLNQLISTIGDNYTPKTIIFYDGVNDLTDGCKVIAKQIPTHSYSKVISDSLKTGLDGVFTRTNINYLFEPYLITFNKLGLIELKIDQVSRMYNCDEDLNKAKKIAKHLVNNWYSAYLISESKNINFIAIVQPSLFFSNTPAEYIPEKQYFIKDQYDIIYPLIRKEILNACEYNNDFCNRIIDGSDWIETTEKVFIDNTHLSKQGNRIVVRNIISNMQRLNIEK